MPESASHSTASSWHSGPVPRSRVFERPRPALSLRASGASSAGRRRSGNQDAFLISKIDAGGGSAGILLVVCDGMGGTSGGAVASHLAASAVTLSLRASWPHCERDPSVLGGCMGEGVAAANRLVRERSAARPALKGMGTTLTAAVAVGAELHIAHVGDSRAYLLREGEAMLLTRDQTVVEEMLDLDLLSRDEAARSPYRHVLARAVGVEREIEPALGRHSLRAGDAVLLCTDGVAEFISGPELAAGVERGRTPGEACRRLVSLARERGAKDDVTVVVGRFLLAGGGVGRGSPEGGKVTR